VVATTLVPGTAVEDSPETLMEQAGQAPEDQAWGVQVLGAQVWKVLAVEVPASGDRLSEALKLQVRVSEERVLVEAAAYRAERMRAG
jgi:hypothetical protein